jgi:phage-related protein
MNYQVELMDSAVEFVQALEVKMRAKVFRTVGLLEQFGPQLPAPHAKALTGCGGLKELRVKQGGNIVRLFYFHHADRVYVVTSGYVKKTQKTNQREIERAIRLMNEFSGGEDHG